MLARTMWLEHEALLVSCCETSPRSFHLQQIDFDRIVQMSFAASDPTMAAARQATPLSRASVSSMFAWSRRRGFSDSGAGIGFGLAALMCLP
jgi:hypothetical protein